MTHSKKQSVCAIVKNEKGEILTLLRRDVPIWVLPGGGIDHGETPKEAVTREVLEETGLHVDAISLLAVYEPKGPFAERTFLFGCRATHGQLLQEGDETLQACFALADSLPKPFLPFHAEWIEEAHNGQEKPLYSVVNTWRPWQITCFFFRYPHIITRYLLGKLGFDTNS